MSVRALARHVAGLHLYASSRRRAVYKIQRLSSQLENGDQEDGKEAQLRPNTTATEGAPLVYNPSAYYRTRVVRSAILGSLEVEEEPSQPVLSAAFRQQSNPYTVSSSRRLSSAKNAMLSLAFSRARVGRSGKSDQHHLNDVKPDVKGDPREFQRSRPEYHEMTHDPSLPSLAIDIKEASSLLHQITLMKGNMEASDIAHFLCELGRLVPRQMLVVRGDTRFYMLLRYSVENLQNFTDSQLLDVLRAFVRLGLSPSHSVLGLYEMEFCHRACKMDLHQLLLVADMWRCLGRSVPQYLERLCDYISQHFNQIGPPEMTQFLYILGEGRRCPNALLQPLEGLLMRHLHKLTAEEVGAVCLGLFKSQSRLSDGAVRRLVDSAYSLLENMSDFGMVNVLKLMRFSHLDHLPWLKAMTSEVPRRSPEMGVQGLMHVALACSSLHYRDDRILLSIAERLPYLVSQCRSKDAAKLLWSFGNLGVPSSECPDLYSHLTEVLREREAEFQQFPEHLLTALLGLAFVGEFPCDLLSLALSPEFSDRASRLQELELKKDLFTLDGAVGKEVPDWSGPRLSPAVREEVTRQLWDFAQVDICQKPEVAEAEMALQELLGGENFVRKRMILPHMRSIDLEVHLNAKEQPIPIAPEPLHHSPSSDMESSIFPHGWEGGHTGVTLTDDLLSQLTNAKKNAEQPIFTPSKQPTLRQVAELSEREGILNVGVDLTDGLLHALTKSRTHTSTPSFRPHKPAVLRLAVQVTNRNHYCYRSQQLLGFHAMKRRQLALEGYKVVELPHWEWFRLLRRSRSEKLAYLHCKIFTSYDSVKKT